MTVDKTRPSHGGHGERGITVLLRRMHDVLAGEATPQQRLDELTRVIAGHVVADVCSIYLRLPTDELELYSTVGLNPAAVHETRLAWGEGLVGNVAATQRPLVTADRAAAPCFRLSPGDWRGPASFISRRAADPIGQIAWRSCPAEQDFAALFRRRG